jgi:hypothetical protein
VPRLSASSFESDVRILYLADIRFPLERANGIQTMETAARWRTEATRSDLSSDPIPNGHRETHSSSTVLHPTRGFWFSKRRCTALRRCAGWPIWRRPSATSRAPACATGSTSSSHGTSAPRRCCSGSHDRCALRSCTNHTGSPRSLPNGCPRCCQGGRPPPARNCGVCLDAKRECGGARKAT